MCTRLRRKGPSKIPQIKQENLAIRLADGSISGKRCGSLRVDVQATNSRVVKLDFFVIQGPNNLLGRHALESMWPSQFNALREIAEVPNVSTAPIANKAKVRAAGKKPRQWRQKS